MVDRDGRDAAPVVDPGVEQPARSPRSGSAAPARATSGGRIRRAAAIVQRSSSSGGSGASAIRVPGFARKFWTITSCTWRARRGDRAQRVEPLRARLADPDQDPRRERHAGLAREPQRLEARRGQLVGRAEVRPAALESRSDVVSSISPIEALTGRSSSKSLAESARRG